MRSVIRSRERSRPRSGVTICERPLRDTATSSGFEEVRSYAILFDLLVAGER